MAGKNESIMAKIKKYSPRQAEEVEEATAKTRKHGDAAVKDAKEGKYGSAALNTAKGFGSAAETLLFKGPKAAAYAGMNRLRDGEKKDDDMKKGGSVKKYASGGTTDEKSLPRRMYEKVMGTPEQNEEAQKRMDARDKKNPDTIPAKVNKVVDKVIGRKAGGKISSASSRADGCAVKGKTKGRMV